MPRQLTDNTWDSNFTARELTAVSAVGFEPVGQVLGTAVFNLGNTGAWDCPGAWTTVGGPSSHWTPSLAPLAKAVHAARRLALARAVAECRALDGDGIVGIQLTTNHFFSHTTEFTAIGTAVRAHGRIRPQQPFTSHLGGQDFARLLRAGWVPTGLALGVSLAIRHDDWRASRLLRGRPFAGNEEVEGHTRLIGHVRKEARERLSSTRASTAAAAATGSSWTRSPRSAGDRVPRVRNGPRPHRGSRLRRHFHSPVRPLPAARRGRATDHHEAGARALT